MKVRGQVSSVSIHLYRPMTNQNDRLDEDIVSLEFQNDGVNSRDTVSYNVSGSVQLVHVSNQNKYPTSFSVIQYFYHTASRKVVLNFNNYNFYNNIYKHNGMYTFAEWAMLIDYISITNTPDSHHHVICIIYQYYIDLLLWLVKYAEM
jgi:hypothetical protein